MGFHDFLPEIGNFSLILALCMALLLASVPLVASWREDIVFMKLSRPLVFAQLLFILIAYFILTYAFITNDFTVLYVAENSNSELPLIYRICAVWGAHEGSMLLWITLLTVWAVAVALFSKKLPQSVVSRVLAILGIVSVGFLWFLLATSNPFVRIFQSIPASGHDLNPLLQDPGLIIHPPTLYMGYVGYSVAFAFAITALISGKFDKQWLVWMRPWILATWCFLTLGITMGSWWAYRDLGWGGWWFWDPVENASFLPWLVGTALIHSLTVSTKREAFFGWTVLLAISAFSLSLVGTFLVRSGVLTSVHAFASDPTRGAFILKFLVIVIGGSLLLYAWRAPAVLTQHRFAFFSRETALLINNVLMTVAMATILLGTIYPLIIEALGLGKLSVGPPYFNTVFIPIVSLLLFFMAIGPHLLWQAMSGKLILRKLQLVAALSVLAGVLFTYLYSGGLNLKVVLGVGLAGWVIMTTLLAIVQRKSRLDFAFIGMVSAHLGVAVTALGIALTSAYSVERDVRMGPGDVAQLGAYQFQFADTNNLQGPNYHGVTGIFHVSHDGKLISTLSANKRIFNATKMVMTDAAIDAGVWRDLYVALGEPLTGNDWSVRLYYKPFVRWIWFGGFMMLFGGIFAACKRRKTHDI